MFRSISVAALGICLLGQGCISLPTTDIRQPISDPLGQPSPDGFVAFREGFGKLPGGVAKTDTPVARIVLATELPGLPTEVAVLREWDTAPNDAVLRNLTTALLIPTGALGKQPRGDALVVRWNDRQGYAWTYDATSRMVLFSREGTDPRTQANIQNLARATETARTFLKDRGADTDEWGEAITQPTSITFAASRDGLPVMDRAGNLVLAASIGTDETGTSVTNGQFALPSPGLDRSNYPSHTAAEVLERLRAGGTNPVRDASASVTFNKITFTHLRETAIVDGHTRVFYIPALRVEGVLHRGDNAEEYATIVPLVKDTAFSN